MPHYVRLDVSQKTTAICVVDEEGRRLWRRLAEEYNHGRRARDIMATCA
jgi:hypothetical protein